jgi:hypothetical protein
MTDCHSKQDAMLKGSEKQNDSSAVVATVGLIFFITEISD